MPTRTRRGALAADRRSATRNKTGNFKSKSKPSCIDDSDIEGDIDPADQIQVLYITLISSPLSRVNAFRVLCSCQESTRRTLPERSKKRPDINYDDDRHPNLVLETTDEVRVPAVIY